MEFPEDNIRPADYLSLHSMLMGLYGSYFVIPEDEKNDRFTFENDLISLNDRKCAHSQGMFARIPGNLVPEAIPKENELERLQTYDVVYYKGVQIS